MTLCAFFEPLCDIIVVAQRNTKKHKENTKDYIKLLEDKVKGLNDLLTVQNEEQVEILADKALKNNEIEKLRKENERLTRLLNNPKKYSDCCGALIDNDEQSFEICTNCEDRI